MTDTEPTLDPSNRPNRVARIAGSRAATLVACAAVALAAVAALWFGVSWARAAFFTDVPRADAREAALDGARQAALNLNSMNPDDIDGTMRLMRSSMTGKMLDDYTTNGEKIKQAASSSKTRLVAKVLGSSLIELNSERDHARSLVVLQQTETPPGAAPARQRVTWEVDMVKTDTGWKAENANSLGKPVLLDAPALAPAPKPGP